MRIGSAAAFGPQQRESATQLTWLCAGVESERELRCGPPAATLSMFWHTRQCDVHYNTIAGSIATVVENSLLGNRDGK